MMDRDQIEQAQRLAKNDDGPEAERLREALKHSSGPAPAVKKSGKYLPHQGQREKARRRKQDQKKRAGA